MSFLYVFNEKSWNRDFEQSCSFFSTEQFSAIDLFISFNQSQRVLLVYPSIDYYTDMQQGWLQVKKFERASSNLVGIRNMPLPLYLSVPFSDTQNTEGG